MNSLTLSKSWKSSQNSAPTNKSFISRLALYQEFSVKCKRRQNTEMLSFLTCSVLILLVRLCKCFSINGQIIPTAEVPSDTFFSLNVSEWIQLNKVEQEYWYVNRVPANYASVFLDRLKKKTSVNLNQKHSNYIIVGSRTDLHPAEIVVAKC